MSRIFDNTAVNPNETIIVTPPAAAYNNLLKVSYGVWVNPSVSNSVIFVKDPTNTYDNFITISGDVTAAIGNNAGGVGGGGAQSASTVGIPIGVNTWTHIAVTYDSTTDGITRIYINGVEVSYSIQNPFSGPFQDDSGGGYWIGNDGSDSVAFGGDIAEFAIWNIALTSGQVAALAASTTGAGGIQSANLVGYWHLCGLVSPEPDSSGNGNSGVLSTNPPLPGPNSPGFSGCITGPDEVFISEVQVTVTYQNPGNYLYARDIDSWGDAGIFGKNTGTPYPLAEIVIGSITFSQPGAQLIALQHVIGYFDSVGTLDNGGPSIPDIWILPNEINATTGGVGFVYLPEVIPEPPEGLNHISKTILARRWPLNMVNSYSMSQFLHHAQFRIRFAGELAPNTIKSIAFSENQN
jgi:hypothetical protein